MAACPVPALAGFCAGRQKEKIDGLTPLHTSMRHGDLALSQTLIEAHPRLAFATDACGDTPLHTALRHSQSAAAMLLLQATGTRDSNFPRALCGVSNGEGQLPVHLAAAQARLSP